MCVCCAVTLCHGVCVAVKRPIGAQFAPATFAWVPRITPRTSGRYSTLLCLLSYLANLDLY